jgi:Xaa-Pro aminopeptidase
MFQPSDDSALAGIEEQFRDRDPLFYAGDALHRRKQESVQDLMEDRDLDALVFFRDQAIRYVTDFYTKGFGPFMDYEYLCVVPRGGEPILGYLSGSDRYRTRLHDKIDDVRRLPVLEDWDDVVVEVFDEYGITGTVGTDIMPFFLYDDLAQRLSHVDFLHANDIWRDLTAIKSPQEVVLVEEAVALAEIGMQAAIEAVEPGQTEIEIAAAAEHAMRSEGSEFTPFISDIVAGKNTAVFNRVPSKSRVRNGDLVVMDLGALHKGYTGEFARTVVAGTPSPKQRKIYQVVYDSLQACIGAIEPGVTCEEVDDVARRVIRDAGYSEYGHTRSTGHQLGYGLHGEPLIDQGVDAEIRPQMIVNVEPRIAMYDEPDVGAVQLEETVLVTEDGVERLTRTRFDEKLL